MYSDHNIHSFSYSRKKVPELRKINMFEKGVYLSLLLQSQATMTTTKSTYIYRYIIVLVLCHFICLLGLLHRKTKRPKC